MKDWAYTFDPVSKKEWIEQVEKDLRQTPVASLMAEWWPGEIRQPLIHQEDIMKGVVRLPNELFQSPPRITEWIDTSDILPETVNKNIHSALKYGAEVILLKLDTLDKVPLAGWLKDVHLDMVNVQLAPGTFSVDHVNDLIPFLNNGVNIRINRARLTSDEFGKIIDAISSNKIPASSLLYVYDIPSKGIWDTTTAALFNQLIDDYHTTDSAKNNHQFFSQCIIALQADQSYFKHIIQTRVLHLLWHNLLAFYEVDKTANSYLECHIISNEIETPDQYLIRASMSGLAASLVGTHSLCIHHLAGENIEEFYKRTNRNIHHLLNLESNMYQGIDPLAGAYTIDYYSTHWTENIWEALQQKK